jgi:hypothetical protein
MTKKKHEKRGRNDKKKHEKKEGMMKRNMKRLRSYLKTHD